MRSHEYGKAKSKRSRGGCSHCRHLRIKCDQHFPTCNQCTKRRRMCDLSATGFRSYTPVVEAPTSHGQVGIAPSPTVSESVNDEPYPLQEGFVASDCVGVPSGLVAYSNSQEESRDMQMRPVSSLQGIVENVPGSQDGQHGHTVLIELLIQEDSFEHSPAVSSDRSSGDGVLPASTAALGRASSLLPRSDTMETSRERSFLLRHFSTTPGRWMDLFDLDYFYNRQVPVLALNSQLIMYSACALAAKQLSAISHIPARSLPYGTDTVCSTRGREMSASEEYAWLATTYYDAAISLLLQHISDNAASKHPSSSTSAMDTVDSPELRRSSEVIINTPVSLALKPHNEVLVAVTILAVYEFLGGDEPTWSNHLDGTRSFLRISDDAGFLNFCPSPSPNDVASGASGLLRATFWNFARQDMLSALIHGKRTRLEMHDFAMWRRMGVSLCPKGFLNVGHHSFHPEHDIDRLDLISNTLVWLLCRIVNFVASCNDNSDGLESEASRDAWDQLKTDLGIWYDALPRLFQPCSRVRISQISTSRECGGCCNHGKALIQHETWHSYGMCASTMQSYHMAQIILTLHEPRTQQTRNTVASSHSNASRPRKFVDALSELNYMSAALQKHAIEICTIAMSRPEEAARIHMLQPLYLAGRCLSNLSDRATVVRLIDSIEDELGWHAKYRVEALLEEWNLDRKTLECCY